MVLLYIHTVSMRKPPVNSLSRVPPPPPVHFHPSRATVKADYRDFPPSQFPSNVILKSCAQRRRFTPEQTANLQTALLHLDGVLAQIPTAQQGSIHS